MRKLVVLTVTLFLLVLAFAGTVWAQEKEITIYVDGKQVVPDVPAYIQNGRTMVPLRFIAEAFGFKVNWAGEGAEWPIQIYPVIAGVNDQLKGVAGDFGFFGMRPGGNELVFKGRKLVDAGTETTGDFFEKYVAWGDVPAEIRDGRTFVPLRLLAEAFGCRVEWDSEEWAVRISRYDPERVISYHPQVAAHWRQDLVPDRFYTRREYGSDFVRILLPVVVLGSRDVPGEVRYLRNVEVIFYIDGREVGRAVQLFVLDTPYSEIGSGGAAEIVVRWPKGETHRVKAVVDPDGKHWDRDKSNNVIEKTLTIE